MLAASIGEVVDRIAFLSFRSPSMKENYGGRLRSLSVFYRVMRCL